jgi:WD40 repeat protein/tetratricopeptide (TPR) repeat protein
MMSYPMPADTAGIDQARQVDQLCTAFEKGWQAGPRPRIEDYLATAAEAVRPAVLRELILVELEYRRRAGEEPRPADYRQRFAEHDTLIATLFGAFPSPFTAGSPAADATPFVTGPDAPATETDPSTPTGQVLPHVPSAPGRVLGDYELLEELGRGSMGVVYKAHQRSANRLVALKVIRADRLEDVSPEQHKEWLERFRTEAQAAARIEHEHVVTVHEVGESAGQLYYSMRYVEGKSLADLLGDGPLPGRGAAAYLEAVARAVHHAHTCGILHRDLKPRNLLVDKSERPHVADFGLAKCLALTGEAGLTHAGVLLGTPSYVSPEQAQDAAHATAQSDVYSLGATLYAVLTGRPPFQGATVAQTLHQVLHQEPVAPRQLNPAIDRDLETIALKCLHKEPGRRYSSAAALAADLRRYLDGRPIQARPVGLVARSWRWCRRNPAVAGLLAAVAVAVVAGTGTAWYLAVDALREKGRADAKTTEAEDNAERAQAKAQEALDNEKKAQDNAAETRRRIGELCVSNGVRLADEGDLFGALLWFAEPMVQDAGNPQAQAMARFRLAAYWRHAPRPTLTQVLFHNGVVRHAEFSPDGRWVVTACSDTTARVWEVATGGPVSLPLKHQGAVLHAAFSPDGRRVVTLSRDRNNSLEPRVWDAATGQLVSPPLKHQGNVLHPAFSPDGCRVVTASRDGSARVWDAATGQPLGPPLIHQDRVVYAAFSPDGRRVVTASRDGSAQVWEAATGQPLSPPLMHQVVYAAFSPDGRRVVTASRDGSARVWEVATGQPLSPPLRHQGRVSQASFSPDGRQVVTASDDKTARVWDAATGQPLCPPLKHQGNVFHATLSPDSHRVVTASADNTARVWEAATGQPLSPPLNHRGPVWDVAFSPDGRRVVTASNDGTVRVWEAATRERVSLPLKQQGAVMHAAFSPDGRWVVTASNDGTARVWEVATGQPLCPPLKHQAPVRDASFSPDGRRVITASYDQTARVWVAATGQPASPPLKHHGEVLHASFSPDGRWVVTASADGSARVWEPATGQAVSPPLKHDSYVAHATFSPDGRRVVTASQDNSARVWEAATGQPLSPPLKHQGEVVDAAFSPDGRRVVTASNDNTARVWEVATGQPISAPLRHQLNVYYAAFSPDGRRVVTASRDGSARVWEAATGQPLSPPMKHQLNVYYAAFNPDGRCVVTASADGTARVWDATTGQPLSPPLLHQGGVRQAAFSPDGRRVVTASEDGTARVWDLAPDERPKEDLLRLVQVLSGHRLDPTGGSVPLTADDFRAAWQILKAKYPQDFSVPADEALTWHRREAEAREAAGEWFAARKHLDRLIEAEPANEALRPRRARASIALGDWQQVIDDYAKLPKLEVNLEQLCEYASVLLLNGDDKGYRQVCRRVQQRFGQTQAPLELYLLARILTLAPHDVAKPVQVVQQLEKAVAAHPGEACFHHTLAVAHYRAGQFDLAVQGLQKSLKLDWGGHVLDWLVLAMANHRLGQEAEARQWLDKAVQWIEQAHKANPGGAAGRLPVSSLSDHLEVLLLRREAEALMRGKAPGIDP